jgi:serine/threonine-protein kinase
VTTRPAPSKPGLLKLAILPWAEVSIDGKPMGTTPLKPISLKAGQHKVVLSNPAYRPLSRTVTIRANQTTRLELNLSRDAIPR